MQLHYSKLEQLIKNAQLLNIVDSTIQNSDLSKEVKMTYAGLAINFPEYQNTVRRAEDLRGEIARYLGDLPKQGDAL